MLKLPENTDEAIELAKLALDGLNAVGAIVAPAKADSAAGAITLIRVILSTIQEGFEGKITADRVREEMAKLTSSLASNDAAADKALDDKFSNDR